MLAHFSDAVAYGLLLLSSFQAASANAPLQVQTSSGFLTGFINCTAPSVRQFLGVPFALPPTRKLRFEPPVKVTDNGPLQVKAFKPSCMQSVSGPVNTSDPNTDVYAIMPQFGINGGISEDCLYLNVYAPLNPTTPSLPVIVWIYGGGFTNGGANVLYQIPDKWVQRTQGHVVVTMNYRLGVFGYPSASGQMKNVGLMDQRMVVEWVRDNIAAFGGDPARISLMGQSAGSASVNFYAYSYVDDPIVAGFIGHSGAASILTSTDASGSNFNKLADSVGCGKLSAAAELQCMQNVDAAKLQAAAESNRSLSFFPYADNITAPANPADRLAKGLVAKKPFLMGNTDNEGGGLSTIGGMTPEARRFGLSGLACPVIDEANQRFQHGYVTYRYLYAGNFSNISPLPWIGACHSCDLPLAFGTHYEYDNTHTGLKSTDLEWGTSFAMEGLWLSFASNPNESPRYKDYTWPQYNPNTTSIALIGFNTPIQPISTGWFDGNCTGL